jgi:DNA-binding CsgD family transcriptional regulator
VDSLLRSVTLTACLVDHDGQILEVSEASKSVVAANNSLLPDHEVGSNILRHWLSPDLESTILYRGLKKVLSREAPFFAALVPLRGADGGRQCMMMAALPVPNAQGRSAIFHLDMSPLGMGISTPLLSRDIVEQMREALTDVVHRSIRHEFLLLDDFRSDKSRNNSEDLAKLRRLSARQMTLLSRLAEGASNAEIAQSLGMSLAAVKAQTTAIMRKLGFENRTQTALFAAKLGLNHGSSE